MDVHGVSDLADSGHDDIGDHRDDMNNADTFGDCDVGEDWKPSFAQDAFEREKRGAKRGDRQGTAELVPRKDHRGGSGGSGASFAAATGYSQPRRGRGKHAQAIADQQPQISSLSWMSPELGKGAHPTPGFAPNPQFWVPGMPLPQPDSMTAGLPQTIQPVGPGALFGASLFGGSLLDPRPPFPTSGMPPGLQLGDPRWTPGAPPLPVCPTGIGGAPGLPSSIGGGLGIGLPGVPPSPVGPQTVALAPAHFGEGSRVPLTPKGLGPPGVMPPGLELLSTPLAQPPHIGSHSHLQPTLAPGFALSLAPGLGLPPVASKVPPGLGQAPMPSYPSAAPRMLSLAEVERQLLEAASVGTKPSQPQTPTSPGLRDALRDFPLAPPVPVDHASGQLFSTPLAVSAAAAIETSAPPASPCPRMVAPFTKGHRSSIADGNLTVKTLRSFLNLSGEGRPQEQHRKLMSEGDKELIVRIQLTQMAAMGNLPMLGPPIQSVAVDAALAGADVISNQFVSFVGAAGASASDDGCEHASASEVNACPKETASLVQLREMLHSCGSESTGEDLVFTEVFQEVGRQVLHGGCMDAKADDPGYWREQLVVERAMEAILELEQISARMSKIDGRIAGQDMEKMLLTRRREALVALSRELFLQDVSIAHAPTSTADGSDGDGAEATAAGFVIVGAVVKKPCSDNSSVGGEAMSDGHIVTCVLARRKGRILLHRLFSSLVPLLGKTPGQECSDDEQKSMAAALLWRLVAALARAPGALLRLVRPRGETVTTESDSIGDARSWRLLGSSLEVCVRVACSPGLREYSVGASSALMAIVESYTGSDLLTLCALKPCAKMMRFLVEGFTGHQETLELLVEAVCRSFPLLCDAAKTRRWLPPDARAESNDLRSLEEVDVLSQDDLWSLLIALMDRGSSRQQMLIHKSVSPYMDFGATSMSTTS